MGYLKPKRFLLTLIFLQISIYVTVFFDVPVARQVLGFAYLSFVPGLIIVKLLGIDKFDVLEILLFSLGFSIAFLMFAGLIINEFSLLLDFWQPFSLIPLMIFLNSIVLFGGFLVYIRASFICLKTDSRKIFPLTPFLMVPIILTIVGTMWVNIFEDNMILLLMLVTISLLFATAIVLRKTLAKLYPFIVLIVAISLLYHSSLISNHIWGADIHMEYFVFKNTANNAYWSSVFTYPWDMVYGRLNSMISITILPTIYSIILNMEATWVLKILYPFIFSFVPLALYKLWQRNIGRRRAFLAAFFFMATNTFYTEILGLNRQIIAELFFALLLLVILSRNITSLKKMTLFTVFSTALIISHYALAEIFLIFLTLSLILSIVFKHPSRNVTLSMVILFFVVMFAWYIYTSNSATFVSFINYGDYVLNQLGDFFNPKSRGVYVLRGLGLEAPPSIWNMIGRAFAYLTEALIIVGFIGIFLRRVKKYFENEYFMFGLTALTFLAALIIIPGLANTMNMTRFYHVLLFFLAPFSILGAEFIIGLISKRRVEFGASILLVMVLVPYFLFQTGFVYEVVGVESWSVPLSKYRMRSIILMRTMAYVTEPQVSAALWFNKNIKIQNVRVWKDRASHELGSYGMLLPYNVHRLTNTTDSPEGVIYLSYVNCVEEKVVTDYYVFNITELSFIHNVNKVYENGNCEIYTNTRLAP